MKQSISIERLLIWTYQIQGTGGYADYDDRFWPRVSADGCAMVEWIAQLGCMPDRGPSQWGVTSPERLTDLSVVHTAARTACSPSTFELVAHCARVGGRPDWKPMARHRLEPLGFVTLQKAKPAWGAKAGETMAETENWYDPDDRCEYQVCPLIEMDSPDITTYSRALYAEWWNGVAVIRALLAAPRMLRDFDLTTEMPPPRPWEDDREMVMATPPVQQCA